MHGRIGESLHAGPIARSLWPPAGRRLEGLVDWLLGLRISWRRISAILAFDAIRYGRVRLLRTPEYEVLLLAWLPGQATPVHSHGGSVGAVRLLVGTLEERRYAPSPEGWVERSRLLYRAPAVLREGRSSVHRVEAVGPGPAVSLHVYSPPLPPEPE